MKRTINISFIGEKAMMSMYDVVRNFIAMQIIAGNSMGRNDEEGCEKVD